MVIDAGRLALACLTESKGHLNEANFAVKVVVTTVGKKPRAVTCMTGANL